MPASHFLRVGLFFYFLFFSLWPSYIDFRPHENVGILPQRLVLLVLELFFFVFVLLSRRFQGVVVASWAGNRRVLLLLVAYASVRFSSAIAAGTYSIFIAINELVSHFVLMLVAAAVYRGVSGLYSIGRALVVMAVFVSLYALVEKSIEFNVLATFADPNTKVGFTAAADKVRDGVFRAQSTFEHPLSLTQYLAMTIPLILLFWGKNRLVSVCIVMIQVVALWGTGSRSALVALLIAAFSILILLGREKYALSSGRRKRSIRFKMWLLYMCAAVAGGGVFVNSILGAGSESHSSSSLTRLSQLNNGILAVSQKPILGFGPGEGSKAIMGVGESVAAADTIYVETTDNHYLSIALESGILALVLYVCLQVSVLLSLVKGIRGGGRRSEQLAFVAIFSSLLAGMVLMTVLSITTVLPLFFFLMGVAVSMSRDSQVRA